MNLDKIKFMLDKFLTDLKTPKLRYPLAEDISSSKLGEYYFVFEEKRVSAGKDQKLISKFDENGIPINKTYIDVTDKDYVYFPISIGQMGLSVYHTWLKTVSEEDKQRFLKFADWFEQNAEISPELGARWLTDVKLPQYDNPGPWASAFSQSRAISILLRAYQITKKNKYAELAELALKPFSIDVEEGGITQFTKWGNWYEEYTADVPTMVLNGMIFALFGLQDFVRVFPENKQARRLLEDGINCVANTIHLFDLGFWSRYNYCRAKWHPEVDPATIQYQRLHISQLQVLHRLTSKKIFADYLQKFQKQDNLLNALRMYKLKFSSLKQIGRL